VNTAAGVIQEVKAGQSIAALSELTAPDARVVRDGEQRQVRAAVVVPGDLLVLAEGDIVPADSELTEAAALLVNESALTGESVPVDKVAGDGVAAGTTVIRGRGRAAVTATGSASAMGRVAALMGAAQALTPLQRRLAGQPCAATLTSPRCWPPERCATTRRCALPTMTTAPGRRSAIRPRRRC
jgi:Ca2+-transporting ATPase